MKIFFDKLENIFWLEVTLNTFNNFDEIVEACI